MWLSYITLLAELIAQAKSSINESEVFNFIGILNRKYIFA